MVWSAHINTIYARFSEIRHGLLHYVTRCPCKEFVAIEQAALLATLVPGQEEDALNNYYSAFNFGQAGLSSLKDELSYASRAGLNSLPELYHLNRLRNAVRGGDNGKLGLFGDQHLEVAKEFPLDADIYSVSVFIDNTVNLDLIFRSSPCH